MHVTTLMNGVSPPVNPSTFVTVQAAAPPVGLLEVMTLLYSTATHKLIVGQEMLFMPLPSYGGW